MAQIKQVGVGRKSIGTIDGITYYVRGGITYARSAPTMPASLFNTPAAKKRQALFRLVQMHLKYHLRTIRQTFTPKGNGSPSNRYFSLNKKGLYAALDALADRYCAGEDISILEVEAAISAYATEHPTSITIAHLSGYQDVYLTGEWPSTITLNASAGDSTMIIIVAENGTTTTYNTDGTVVVTNGSSSGSSSSSQSSGAGGTSTGGSSTGSNQGSGSGSSTGSVTSSNPRLTINRSGSGTATVTAGGNAVSSGAELAAGTEVGLSITPAEGATPTATLGSQSVTLTESDGTYTGSFTMPSSNVTLTINTGGTSGGSGSSGEN